MLASEHEDKQRGRGVMHTRTEAFGLVRMEGGTVRGRAGHLINTRALPLRRYGADPPTSQSQRQQQHLRPLAKLATSAVLGLSLVLSPPSPLCLAKQLSPAETIVQEVYEVVDQHFLDARDGGYSSERWQELRKDALRDLGKGKRVEEEGGRLPAEHGHGTEYAAPAETSQRWQRMDPTNTMNPGVGRMDPRRWYGEK